MTVPSKEEIEFKWAVESPKQFGDFLKAVRETGAGACAAVLRVNNDFYLDTAGRTLERAKITCRVRSCGRSFELTIKGVSRIKAGLARRAEKNIPLPGVRKLDAALALAQTLVPRPVAKAEPLLVCFRVENRRKSFNLAVPGAFKANACFDDVTIYTGLKTVGMREIELEYMEGRLSRFMEFVRLITCKTALPPAKMSKVATARAALKYLH